jgi:hypothetical protein
MSSSNQLKQQLLMLAVVCLLPYALLASPTVKHQQETIAAAPYGDFSHIDPIDMCLFICNACYEQEVLLECANEFCLAKMSPNDRREATIYWSKRCPGLATLRRRR